MGASRSQPLFDPTGKVAIVTGTSRGLGQYFGRAPRMDGVHLKLQQDAFLGRSAPQTTVFDG